MAGGIFNPENDIWRLLGKLTDLIILSVFWLVCSLPVFTLGPATAALYHTVVRCIRGDDRSSWSLFFRTFRDNFKVGALATLAVLAAGGLLLLLHGLLYQLGSASRAGFVLYMGYTFLLLLPLGMACFLFPVLSRFTFGVAGLLSSCVRLAMAHLPSTLAVAVIFYLAQTVFLYLPVTMAVLPAVTALLHSLFLARIFAPYVRAQAGTEGDGGGEDQGL